MSRITLQEAARLGIDVSGLHAGVRSMLSAADIKAPKGRASTKPGVAVVQSRDPRPPRRSTKPGRLPRSDPGGHRELSFFVPGVPVTKQRARTFLDPALIMRAFAQCRGDPEAFRAAIGGLRHRSVTPRETADYEGVVGRIAAAAMRSMPPFREPVVMEILFTFDGDAGLWPTDVTDADLDNVEKAVCDALNGIAWHDDRLVVGKSSFKVCGPEPGVRVRIRAAGAADGITVC